MTMVAQPLDELIELRKMDHRLLEVRAKNKMANVGSSNGCATIGISPLSQCHVPRDIDRYATKPMTKILNFIYVFSVVHCRSHKTFHVGSRGLNETAEIL
jgi:hypothetical protein